MTAGTNNPLEGITRRSTGANPSIDNPNDHSPFRMQNKVILEKYSPNEVEGELPVMTQRSVQAGNLAQSSGLDVLCNLLATSALAFTATNAWIQVGAIGTTSTAPTFDRVSLFDSTKSVHISDGAGNMLRADAGINTLQYAMTFSDGDPYTIKEVGLFGSSLPTGGMAFHSSLAATDQVIKGASDTVNVSHQIIFTSV